MRIQSVLLSAVAVLVVFLQGNIVFAAFRNGAGSPNVTLVLNETLEGDPLNHYPVSVVLTSSGDAMQVNFFAPYLGEDAVQRLHVFVANEDKHITEFEFNKEKGANEKANTVVRLYWAPFNVLRTVDQKSGIFTVKSQIVGETWTGTATLPIAFLPPRPSLVSAAVAHEIGEDKHWDNFYSITNPGISIPDLMVLHRYKEIDPKILSSETSYSPEWKSG